MGSGCQDGIINLYNLYNGSFLRSFKHPNNNPINMVFIIIKYIYRYYSVIDH